MKALLLDTNKKVISEVNPNGLDDYYSMINCGCIDIVSRRIGKRYYEFICDDEGLFVDDPLVSAISDMGEVMLVGNLIITGLTDGEGELTDLTDDDISYIKKHIITQGTRKHPEGLLMVCQCEY